MKHILYLIAVISLAACKGERLNPENGIGDVRIRIWNSSDYIMSNIFVDTSGGQNEYGELKSGGRSAYKQFTSAYRYAFISFKINGQALNIQPIDYVGEIPLEKGDYTYKITVDNVDSPFAYLEFIEE